MGSSYLCQVYLTDNSIAEIACIRETRAIATIHSHIQTLTRILSLTHTNTQIHTHSENGKNSIGRRFSLPLSSCLLSIHIFVVRIVRILYFNFIPTAALLGSIKEKGTHYFSEKESVLFFPSIYALVFLLLLFPSEKSSERGIHVAADDKRLKTPKFTFR